MRSLSLAALLLLSSAATAQTLRHVRVEAEGAVALAASLEQRGFDVLEGSVRPGSLELVVTDASFDELTRMGYSPILVQVGRPFRDIQAERQEDPGQPADPDPDMVPAGYPDLATVNAQMAAAAANFPAICEWVDLTTEYGLPRTSRNRKIWAVKISDNVSVDEDEPAFLMHSAAHCREIVTPVIALHAMDQLTTGYGVDPDITAIVDEYEIWIVPVANPDGYNYVFEFNNLWRKNRRQLTSAIGVDLNRNYPFGWTSGCSGSASEGSETYKGPSAGSEVETQTIMALSMDQRFTKVIDYHSSGREVLWEYNCNVHPLANYLRNQAIMLSNQSGYGGSNRPPSADGEHYEWQLAQFSNHAFLIETHTSFQPSFASAQNEAVQVWGGIKAFLELPIPVAGHVTDSCTGLPVEASISYPDLPFTNGETNTAEPAFGRYHAFVPPEPTTLRFEAPGYITQDIVANVTETGTVNLDVQLVPTATATATFRNGMGLNPACYTNVSPAVLGGTMVAEVSHAAHPGATFTVIVGYPAAGGGIVNKFGEVLVDVGSGKLFQSLVPSSGTEDTHSLPIPNDPCFAGFFVATQAVILGGGAESCNAVDYVVGS